jgi:hypothetical protein
MYAGGEMKLVKEANKGLPWQRGIQNRSAVQSAGKRDFANDLGRSENDKVCLLQEDGPQGQKSGSHFSG